MSTKLSLVGMTAAIFVLSACTEEEPAKTARTWKCTPVTMGGTQTLACASSSLTADGPSTIGAKESTTDGVSSAKGNTTDGVSSPTGGGGGSAVDVYVAIWADHDSSYRCQAGAESCPPIGAHAGTNTSDGVSSDGTATAGGGGGAGGGTKSGGTSDGTTANAGDPASGGATSVNGSGGTTGGSTSVDGSGGASGGGATSVDGSGGAAGGGGTSVGGSGGATGSGATEQYDCRAKGDVVACVKHDGSAEGTSGGTTSGAGGAGGAGGGSGVGAVTETSNGTTVKYDGSTDNGDGTTTSCWTVTEHGHDLTKWVISIGRCEIVRRSPTIGYAIVIRDASSGLTGVSWSTETEFTTGQFCMTVKGAPTISKVKFSANASGESYGTTLGPVCPCE